MTQTWDQKARLDLREVLRSTHSLERIILEYCLGPKLSVQCIEHVIRMVDGIRQNTGFPKEVYESKMSVHSDEDLEALRECPLWTDQVTWKTFLTEPFLWCETLVTRVHVEDTSIGVVDLCTATLDDDDMEKHFNDDACSFRVRRPMSYKRPVPQDCLDRCIEFANNHGVRQEDDPQRWDRLFDRIQPGQVIHDVDDSERHELGTNWDEDKDPMVDDLIQTKINDEIKACCMSMIPSTRVHETRYRACKAHHSWFTLTDLVSITNTDLSFFLDTHTIHRLTWCDNGRTCIIDIKRRDIQTARFVKRPQGNRRRKR